MKEENKDSFTLGEDVDSKWFKFKPKEDITALELAKILVGMDVAINDWVMEKIPELKRHFVMRK